MKVGFFTMPLHPPGSLHSETLDSDLEQLVLLDQLGFEEAWIGEHFTAEWENIPSPDLLIAQASAITKQMKFGTGVTCMPNHNPFTIAHRIAQLDQMLKGRFIWGVGAGGFPGDLTAFGFDTESSAEYRQMSFESVDLVLKLWADPTPGRYKSKWWDFSITDVDDEIGMRVHMVPYQKPHPPIGVAGVSAKSETLVMAGEKGWLPMSINFIPSRILKTHWDSVKKGAAKMHKEPNRNDWRIAREVIVAETTKEAIYQAKNGVLNRDMEGYLLKILQRRRDLDTLKIDPNMPDSDVTMDYLINHVFIVGSSSDVKEKLEELHDSVGGFGVLLAMGHEWQPANFWESSMGMLVDEVIAKI